MYRSALILMGLGALVAPFPAGAANWLKSGQSPGSATQSLFVGSWASNAPTAETDDSGILGVSNCENVDVLFFDDSDGDGTASGINGVVRSCPSASADAQGCWAVENLTLDGDPATNTEAIYGFAANWIYIDYGGAETDDASTLVIVRCNGTWR